MSYEIESFDMRNIIERFSRCPVAIPGARSPYHIHSVWLPGKSYWNPDLIFPLTAVTVTLNIKQIS